MPIDSAVRNILAFNSGIEEVLRMREQQPSLPSGGTIDPGASARRPSPISGVLFSPSINEEMERSLRPQTRTPSILVPTRYKALLSQARQTLEQAAANHDDAIFSQAARFLGDLESQHRELDARRNAMNRG